MLIKCKYKVADCATNIAKIFNAILQTEDEIDRNKEHVWAMGLNTQLRVEYIELVTLGVLDASLVHPREVFRRAIQLGVSRIVVVHNHPSGNCEPSREDYAVTAKLKQVGEIIGIALLDHIVVSADDATQYRSCI